MGSRKIIPSSDLAIGDTPCSCNGFAINRVVCQLNHHLSRLMSARAAAQKGFQRNLRPSKSPEVLGFLEQLKFDWALTSDTSDTDLHERFLQSSA